MQRLLPFVFTLLIIQGCRTPSVEPDFFNGKDLTGWTAADLQYWSVEDSAIVGHADTEVERNQFLWSTIKVEDFYLSVDVKLDSNDKNAGIQFRSIKANDYGQAMGYQADIGFNYGTNIWGTLYYEDGRGLLQTSDPRSVTIRNNEWNRYEILASGNHIWIAVNGKIVSAVNDKGGDTEGYIALQIHSGPAQTVRYKIRELVHHPQLSIAGKKDNELIKLLNAPLVPVPGFNSFNLKSGDVVAFAGGTNIANMNSDGYLETLLSTYFKNDAITFRNIGWEGDQVYEQFRDVGFGDWLSNIDSINATTVFLQFGQMESLRGEAALPQFIAEYKNILDKLKASGKQIVVLSPNHFEPDKLAVNDSAHWNNPLQNTALQIYFNAIQLLAQQEGYLFADLHYTLPRDVTYDGIHLDKQGQQAAANIIMKSLGIGTPYTEQMEELRQQIITKNTLWSEYWKPGNWAFLYGDRTQEAFSRHWKDASQRIFPEEIKKYQPLLLAEERKIRQILEGETLQKENPAMQQVATNIIEDNSIAEELATFKLDKNYSIELFASESLGIADPCAMRWDEKGRLWVLCIPNYPQPLPGQLSNDKLIVLEDKNQDGSADTSYVFADSLNIPLGFELGHNGVFIGEQSRLLFIQDTNSDLQSDSKKVLLSGFGTHDSHQTINSFTWSPGGELFFAQGLSIHSFVETATGVKKAHRGSIWRYRPRTKELDKIVDQSTASDNPWGITFGDRGEVFSKSNDTGMYYLSPALVLSDHQALVPEIGATRIKSGIIEFPRSRHLPDEIRNDLLIAGYYNNKVERLKVTQDGAGFKATLVEPLLLSTGKNFRPVDIKTGPDGAIYVLDWYNPIIGHYQASLRDPQRDKTHGRIWRITAKNRKLSSPPSLADQPLLNLLNALRSDEYWVRYQARRLLAAKPAKEVIPALRSWSQELSLGTNLLEALAMFESFETINTDLLQRCLQSPDAGVRAYAAQVVGRWCNRLNNPLELIKPLVKDHIARVRLMAIVACGNIHSADAMKMAAEALSLPVDRFIDHAFEKTVFALRHQWEPALRDGSLHFRTTKQLAKVIGIANPEWYTPVMYRHLLSSAEPDAASKKKLLAALAAKGSPTDIEYIFSQPLVRENADVINEIAKTEKRVITPQTLQRIQTLLTGSRSIAITEAVVRLIRTWDIRSLSPILKTLVNKPGQNDFLLAQMINTLISLKADNLQPIFERFITSNAKAVRVACINGQAKANVEHGAMQTMREIKSGNGDIGDIRESIVAIIYEPGGLEALTREINHQGISSSMAAAMLVALDQKHVTDKRLLDEVQRHQGKEESFIPKEYDQQFISSLAQKVKNEGLGNKGKAIYDKLSCNSCHKIDNRGGNIGPPLSAVGKGLSVQDIITEVLWPNKNVKEGFNTVMLELKNGETVQGIRALETTQKIAIKATASSPVVDYNKDQVNRITLLGSSMPGGLVNSLPEQDLADLLRYLSELRDQPTK